MKKMSSNEIRESWINFFKSKQHYFLEPASLVPNNDPSLLWVNSGVATLKDYFSGKKNPPANRLVNSQKALRTNDFFNVGLTSRHHTLFEMLGNFSIGDYFKKEAIHFAYELLVKHWEIDVNKLWITVFDEDEETFNIWSSLGINPKRIIKCNRDRNFWDVGNGPCGPCTEIHYDRGEEYDFKKEGEKLILEDIENDRYVEIWNIVFSQFNNDGKNNYTELLRKNIDTGAGLERLACISQNVPTNFDSDLFQPIICELGKLTNNKYDMNAYFKNDKKQNEINFMYKVIADHFRASVFAIADGVIPDSKDRGYILRRLLRRAMVFAFNLGINIGLWVEKVVNAVINSLQPFYSYLITEKTKIIKVINHEYSMFNETLKQGIKIFDEAVKKGNLNGEIVFKLVTTYGFPIELIKELANKDKIKIDETEFKKRFAEHQQISNANVNAKAMDNQNNKLISLKVDSKFIYDLPSCNAKIVKLFDEDFNDVEKLSHQNGYVVFDQTVFYATSGGQQYDTGYINEQYFVDNVFKGPNLQHIHHVVNGCINLNENVKLEINFADRKKNMAHHSSEHLLQSALKKFVDKNIKQQGAFKSPTKLTFDFQHHEKISNEVLNQIENWINNIVESKIDVEVLMMSLEDAKKNNAAAYFEDVYKKIGGLLRVIKIGDKSLELCGGTHVKNTSEIQKFAITDYYSKGSGQWRIEGISGLENIENYKNDFLTSSKAFLEQFIANVQNEDKNEFIDEYQKFIKSINHASLKEYPFIYNEFKKTLNQIKLKQLNNNQQDLVKEIKHTFSKINHDKKLLVLDSNKFNNEVVLKALNELINENLQTIFAILLVQDNKIQYLFACNSNFKFNVNEIISNVNSVSDGKGLGKANFARGGTNKIDTKEQILAYLSQNGFKQCVN